jgi:hypothetical protein
MGVRKSTVGHANEHSEDLESASLIPNKECHKCSSAARSDRSRHLFKTVVLVALAYICFLETSTRLVMQSHETHIHLAGALPYCKQTLVYRPVTSLQLTANKLQPTKLCSTHRVEYGKTETGHHITSNQGRSWIQFGTNY